MWSNPDWVVYSPDGRWPLGRGSSLSAALASARSNEDWLGRQRTALEPWPWPGLALVGGWPPGGAGTRLHRTYSGHSLAVRL